jgi:hypothetical protein
VSVGDVGSMSTTLKYPGQCPAGVVGGGLQYWVGGEGGDQRLVNSLRFLSLVPDSRYKIYIGPRTIDQPANWHLGNQ